MLKHPIPPGTQIILKSRPFTVIKSWPVEASAGGWLYVLLEPGKDPSKRILKDAIELEGAIARPNIVSGYFDRRLPSSCG